jgi:hypothetical protein
MSKIIRTMALIAMAAAFAKPVGAQIDPLAAYETLLAQHSSAAQALSADPSLYRSPGFMAAHPEVWSYLNQNPGLYQSLTAKVPAYSPDAGGFNLSNYLHYHPDIAQALAANPSIVNNPAYLAQHPNFKGFLQHHPGVAQQLSMRGWNFTRWEQTHPWDQRNQWRNADAWSDRDWRQEWERQQQIFNERREDEIAEEEEEHEHHDHGKHLGWYKHPGKHHDDQDEIAEEEEEHEHHDHSKHLGWYKHPGKHHDDEDEEYGHHKDHGGHHGKHHGDDD